MERSADHATFTIERTYDASPARVFAAWAEPATKIKWFGDPTAPAGNYQLDFRVGGDEISRGGPPGGPVYTYRANYAEIVPAERIVSTYTMDMDERRISVSVATLEFKKAGSGTRMVYTEQAVYFDGLDTAKQREIGCTEIMDALGRYLAGAEAVATH
jgi:uncharacterized protein YndB with AHSA1/START domain